MKLDNSYCAFHIYYYNLDYRLIIVVPLFSMLLEQLNIRISNGVHYYYNCLANCCGLKTIIHYLAFILGLLNLILICRAGHN